MSSEKSQFPLKSWYLKMGNLRGKRAVFGLKKAVVKNKENTD
jgi:hypothetical protein